MQRTHAHRFRSASLCLLLFALAAWGAAGGALFVSAAPPDLPDVLADTCFFGESTTAHLSRAGGVLDTPQGRPHVWRDAGGTRMLDMRILSSPVLDPDTGATLPFSEMLAQRAPRRLILSFGLNGIRAFAKNPEALLAPYRHLIEGIRRISPDTEICLQSVYPVGENSVFSADPDTVNREITLVNRHVEALCRDEGLTYLNTATLLCDADGRLRRDCDVGDGIHLTDAAYRELLAHIAHLLWKGATA